MIEKIRLSLMLDDYIKDKVGDRIQFFEYPETSNMGKTFIIIDPLDVPMPGDYADDTWLTDDYLYQVEVWSHNYHESKKVAERIRHVMWGLGFGQGSGLDEWENDYNIYRDARRYRGKEYREDIDSL